MAQVFSSLKLFRSFRAFFHGKTETRKKTNQKSPPFSMQDSQANSTKKSTEVFWRAVKAAICDFIPRESGSRAGKRRGCKQGGFPIWTCPSFFVLFCPFWDFLNFSGIFPICPFPLSRPIKSTYEEPSQLGPQHNPDLSRKKVGTPPPPPRGPGIEQIHSRSNAWKKPFPHARNFHSRLKFSFSVCKFHSRLKISIPGPVFLPPESSPEWKKKTFSIENYIPYWKLDFFKNASRDWVFSILGPSGPGLEAPLFSFSQGKEEAHKHKQFWPAIAWVRGGLPIGWPWIKCLWHLSRHHASPYRQQAQQIQREETLPGGGGHLWFRAWKTKILKR